MPKRILLPFVALAAFASCTAAEDIAIEPGRVEVILAPGSTPTTRFAAEELRSLLCEVLGEDVPLVEKSSGGKVSIVLENSPLERDEFRIRADANLRRVTISGRDAKDDVGKLVREGKFASMRKDMSTLFVVY